MSFTDPYVAGLRTIPALEWLAQNHNEYPLASNRHGNAAGARTFIESLFRAGATAVYIADPSDEPSRIELEGGPYSDTVVVSLPAGASERAALFQIFAVEAEHEGFAPPQDEGQTEVVLWWD